MNVHENAERLSKEIPVALLPTFNDAYTSKMSAFARHWYTDEGRPNPKGGRGYTEFRDFLADCSRHKSAEFGAGPFVSSDKLEAALSSIMENEHIISLLPEDYTFHLNPSWVTEAAELFLNYQRFADKKTDLSGMKPYYRSKVGVYFVKQTEQHPH